MQLYLQIISLFAQNASLKRSENKTKGTKQINKLYSLPFALYKTGINFPSVISCYLCYVPNYFWYLPFSIFEPILYIAVSFSI